MPTLIVNLFDRDSTQFETNKISLLLNALNSERLHVSELMKIGEGSYLTMLLQICFTLKIDGVQALLERVTTVDNQLFSFLLA